MATATTNSWFSDSTKEEEALSLDQMKAQVLQLGAALDRGQAYNPTSGAYYEDTMKAARAKIDQLLETSPDQVPTKLDDISGEWELVLSTVPHGIFRSSPFFLAIQESYEYAEEKGMCIDCIKRGCLKVCVIHLVTSNLSMMTVFRTERRTESKLVLSIARTANLFLGRLKGWSCRTTH